MDRDGSSTDSSSWSLVDVDDDYSDADSVSQEIAVHSVHDSDDSDYDGELDDVDADADAVEENEDDDDDVDVLPVGHDHRHESEYDSDAEADSENDDEDDVSENDDEECIHDDLEVVSDDETLDNSASLHYVSPDRVSQRLDLLCQSNEAHIAFMTTTFIFGLFCFGAIVLSTTVTEFATTAFNAESPVPGQEQCSIADRPLAFHFAALEPGLQSRVTDLTVEEEAVEAVTSAGFSELLERSRREFETRLHLYRRAARQFKATKISESAPKPSSPTCTLIDHRHAFVNATKALVSSLATFANLTVPMVQKALLPTLDRSLTKAHSWSRRVLDSLPSHVRDLRTYARRASTALAKANFSLIVPSCREKGLKIVRHLRSALSRLLPSVKKASDVCFLHNVCAPAIRFAEVLGNASSFVKTVGRHRATDYIDFLRSLRTANCSAQLDCERVWWTSCRSEYGTKTCVFRDWQARATCDGAAMLDKDPALKGAAIEIGWLPEDERHSRTTCPVPPAMPLAPKPTTRPLPCHTSSTKPCTAPKSAQPPTVPCPGLRNSARPCPDPDVSPKAPKKAVKTPSAIDWLQARAKARAEHRHTGAGVRASFASNWLQSRAKARAEQRTAATKPAKPIKMSKKPKKSTPVPPPKSVEGKRRR